MENNNKLHFEINGQVIDEDAYLEIFKNLFPNNKEGVEAINDMKRQIEKLKSKQNEQHIS